MSQKNQKYPLVSTLIPAFNAEKYLKEAIMSAISQTYPNIEIIVVDNASKDKTAQIVKRMIKENKTNRKIKYFYTSKRGLSLARNIGIKNAKGKYLAFLDADDMWFPKKIEKQVAKLEHLGDEYGLIYTWVQPISDEGITNVYIEKAKKTSVADLIHSCFIQTSTAMVTKSAVDDVGDFDETYDKVGSVQDLEFFIRVAEKYRITFCDETLSYYRLHKNQDSRIPSTYKARVYLHSQLLKNPNLKKYRHIMFYKIMKNKAYLYYLRLTDKITKKR